MHWVALSSFLNQTHCTHCELFTKTHTIERHIYCVCVYIRGHVCISIQWYEKCRTHAWPDNTLRECTNVLGLRKLVGLDGLHKFRYTCKDTISNGVHMHTRFPFHLISCLLWERHDGQKLHKSTQRVQVTYKKKMPNSNNDHNTWTSFTLIHSIQRFFLFG